MAAAAAELAGAPAYRFWPESARDRLSDLLHDAPAALVMSGHVHQYRELDLGGTQHLWAPTTWAVLPDQVQPVLGTKRCGIVAAEFTAGDLPKPVLVEPAGLVQLTQTIDIPDRYHR